MGGLAGAGGNAPFQVQGQILGPNSHVTELAEPYNHSGYVERRHREIAVISRHELSTGATSTQLNSRKSAQFYPGFARESANSWATLRNKRAQVSAYPLYLRPFICPDVDNRMLFPGPVSFRIEEHVNQLRDNLMEVNRCKPSRKN
jgi:hypothetical protein